jgi:photosystem II protein PsbQ
MARYRSILASILAIAIVVCIGFSNPAFARPAKKLTYTAAQIEEIRTAATDLTAMVERLPELGNLLEQQDYIFARNFIHGPLGELRIKLSAVTRNLLPDAQKSARQVAREIAEDFEDLDRVAADRDAKASIRYYNEALKDLDAFFKLLPQG